MDIKHNKCLVLGVRRYFCVTSQKRNQSMTPPCLVGCVIKQAENKELKQYLTQEAILLLFFVFLKATQTVWNSLIISRGYKEAWFHCGFLKSFFLFFLVEFIFPFCLFFPIHCLFSVPHIWINSSHSMSGKTRIIKSTTFFWKKKCMFSQVPVQSRWFNSAWWNYFKRI